jgi:hypothetical protein
MVFSLPWGERVRVRGEMLLSSPPNLNPPPSRERIVFLRIGYPAALLRGTSLKSPENPVL